MASPWSDWPLPCSDAAQIWKAFFLPPLYCRDTASVAKTFANVTQISEHDASFYLESCGGNIELALNMFLNQQQSHGVSAHRFSPPGIVETT